VLQVVMMMMGYFLVFEVPPLLRESVDFLVAWEVLQTLGFKVWKVEHHKSHLWDWNPSLGFFTIMIWAKTMGTFQQVMDKDDKSH